MVGILRGMFFIISVMGLLLVGVLAILRLEDSTAYLPIFHENNSTTAEPYYRNTLDVVTPAGKLFHRIYEGDGYPQSIIVSPDEEWLYLYEGGLYLTRIRTDFSQREHLPYIPGFQGFDCFSPDGKWLLFHQQVTTYSSLYRMRPDGTDVQQITSPLWSHECKTWTPDNEWIIFQNATSQNNVADREVFRIRPDGTGLQNLTNHPGIDTFGGLTEDGQWLIFWSDRQGNGEIFRVRIDGTDLENLTNHRAVDGWILAVQRDWIYFASNRSGNKYLYRMRLNGHGLERLSENISIDYRVSLSPDGRWLAYMDDRTLYHMRTDGSRVTLVLENTNPLATFSFPPDSSAYYFAARVNNQEYSNLRVQLNNGDLRNLNVDGTLVGFFPFKGDKWLFKFPAMVWGISLVSSCIWLYRRHRNA